MSQMTPSSSARRARYGAASASKCSVATPSRIAAAWRCNLLEEEQEAEEVGDGVVTLTLRPFQIVTLRLRRTDVDEGRAR